MSRILVLGATGTIGGQVAAQLAPTDHLVRAGVRTPAKAQSLADAGVEVVHFDFDDPTTWSAALEGVERVFVVAPMSPTFAEPVTALLDAAKAAGVLHVVKLSAQGASVDAPFAIGRQHGLGDAAVRATGLSHTILQPTFFMDNVFNFHGHTLASDGAFYGASAGGASSYVASSDVAAVAVAALLDPSAHDGQTYVITGPEPLTDTQVAAKVGSHLAKDVRYVDLPVEHLGAGMSSNGIPDFLVEALLALEGVKAQGWAAGVDPTAPTVLGRPVRSFDDWLASRA